ncbi:MAG: asparagine synthetase B, partial [Planctomycetota bacterium]|nr:asparagine synthetase B [Planctomycetota bacterium]
MLSNISDQLPTDIENRLHRALNAIQHRGPDARGTYVDPKKRFAFGHIRLSVIDIAATSNQPFWSSCGRYCIIFNGEIYNYIELRERLTQEGVVFRSQSDTEVLLQAIIKWGTKCLNMLNGMWGLVFVDTQTGRFLISRDRFGVKQLYTFEHNGSLIICSEAKGILAYVDSMPAPN